MITVKVLLKYFSVIIVISACGSKIENFSSNNKLPDISPDYKGIVLPPNIAPLNFEIKNKGKAYHIDIYSKNGDKISISQSSPKIVIPLKKWHNLLNNNKGNELKIDIFVKDKEWIKYQTISDTIAFETIDNHIAYRLINAVYIFWRNMGIYQRNLENFNEKAIYQNQTGDENCVNCHSFCLNNPEKMSLHFRKKLAGTMIKDGDVLKKINTKTDYTMAAGVYPSWHPSGKYISYSVNLINQSFTSDKDKLDEVTDLASDIIIYNVKTNTVTTSPKVSTKNRENLPVWSPDGKTLYYISAPETEKDLGSRINVKYSLVKIDCNPDNGIWGNPDTVLSSTKTGMSITFPRISPDGKFLVFCMIEYGYFSIYDKKSDLYIMDLNTREYRKMELNSVYNESYHSWSSNSRWLAFSSKRMDNVYSRPFFSYIDKNGKSHKPFVMPEKIPGFYNSFFINYNVPELISGEVKLTACQTRDLVNQKAEPVQFDMLVDVDALSGATRIKK